MPAKSRRPATKRRKTTVRRRRPRWVIRVVVVAAVLFAVFCAAAGVTFWFAETLRDPQAASAGPVDTGERFTQEERDALDNVLDNQDPAAKP